MASGRSCDKSLVHRTEVEADEPRYGMLETVREFGLEQLAAAARRRRRGGSARGLVHAVGGTDVARDGRQADAAWLNQIEVDHDNVRAALVWLEQSGDVEALYGWQGRSGRSGIAIVTDWKDAVVGPRPQRGGHTDVPARGAGTPSVRRGLPGA